MFLMYGSQSPNIPMSKVHLHLFSEVVAGIEILTWALKKEEKFFYSMYYLLCLFIHTQGLEIIKLVQKLSR